MSAVMAVGEHNDVRTLVLVGGGDQSVEQLKKRAEARPATRHESLVVGDDRCIVVEGNRGHPSLGTSHLKALRTLRVECLVEVLHRGSHRGRDINDKEHVGGRRGCGSRSAIALVNRDRNAAERAEALDLHRERHSARVFIPFFEFKFDRRSTVNTVIC